jgi:hypothetical protein
MCGRLGSVACSGRAAGVNVCTVHVDVSASVSASASANSLWLVCIPGSLVYLQVHALVRRLNIKLGQVLCHRFADENVAMGRNLRLGRA